MLKYCLVWSQLLIYDLEIVLRREKTVAQCFNVLVFNMSDERRFMCMHLWTCNYRNALFAHTTASTLHNSCRQSENVLTPIDVKIFCMKFCMRTSNPACWDQIKVVSNLETNQWRFGSLCDNRIRQNDKNSKAKPMKISGEGHARLIRDVFGFWRQENV